MALADHLRASINNLADQDSEWVRNIEASSFLNSANPAPMQEEDCSNPGCNNKKPRRKRKKGSRKVMIAQ
eukprot:8043692-Heterocapsa_arctica.AAC.1